MDNAAQLLYDRLKEWQTPPAGAPLIESRAIDGVSWIDTHLETLRWFVQVRDRMTSDVYTDVVNNMAIAIFGSDVGATGQTDGYEIIPDSDLLVLKMLADNWGDVGYSPSSLGDIGNVTDEIIEFITVHGNEIGCHAGQAIVSARAPVGLLGVNPKKVIDD